MSNEPQVTYEGRYSVTDDYSYRPDSPEILVSGNGMYNSGRSVEEARFVRVIVPDDLPGLPNFRIVYQEHVYGHVADDNPNLVRRIESAREVAARWA